MILGEGQTIRIKFPPTFQAPDELGDEGKSAHQTVVKAKMASNSSQQKPSTQAGEHTGTMTETDSGTENPTSKHYICFPEFVNIFITLYKAPRLSGQSSVTIVGDEGRTVKKHRV